MKPTDQFEMAGPNATVGVKPTIPQVMARCKRCEGRLNLSALFALVVISCSLLLTACDRGVLANDNKESEHGKGAPASVVGVHHLGRGHHIGEFSIDGRSCGNAGGPEKNSGSNTMCSINLPEQWRPGIKHKVRWGVTNYTDDLKGLQKGNAGQWYEAEAELERFGGDDPVFEVHFYPNGVVRLVPNGYGPPDEDISPEQTPPLSETPLYPPSWYFMGQTLAKQKHEKLTADDEFRLERAQKNAGLYFAFLERLWRSRGLSEEQIKQRLDEERRKSEVSTRGGYSTYLDHVMEQKGFSKQEIKRITKDWPSWTIEETDKRIRYYMTQSGAKK